MLILFDLDDTLIETSKCLTPYSLKNAFCVMQQKGLNAPEFAFNSLLEINKKSLSSKIALKQFWKLYSNQLEILNSGFEAMSCPLSEEISLEVVPGALKTLGELKKLHDLALVTIGDPYLQFQKMKKAGIQPSQFSKLIVSKGPSKKSDYQQILNELGYHSRDAVVCGDRIPIDLTPGKELGLFTVHFRNGRGLHHDAPKESVDLTITTLTELLEVFAKYEGESSIS